MVNLIIPDMLNRDETEINEYFKKSGSLSYYACYPSYYSFLNSGIRKCSFIDGELVVSKNNKPYILFRENDGLAKKIKAEEYLYLNHQRSKSDEKEVEYIWDLDWISNLTDSDIRYRYNYVRRRFDTQIKDLSQVPTEKLVTFLDKWKEEHRHYFRLTTRRDYKLLELQDKLIDVVALSQDKVISTWIATPHPNKEDMIVSIFHKGLISHRHAELFAIVSGSRKALDMGFKFSNDSCAGTSGLKRFKEKLKGGNGRYNIIYNSKIS